MSASSSAAERAIAMRRDFDRGFAVPVHFDMTATENLLAIKVGTQCCALRLSEISGLVAAKKITRIPGATAALLGIAGFRGTIVPVYSVRALLGTAGDSAASRTPRWLVTAAAEPVAFAFEGFEGQLRVMPDAILPWQSRTELTCHAREFVQIENLVRPIIHLPSLLDAIKTSRTEAAIREER